MRRAPPRASSSSATSACSTRARPSPASQPRSKCWARGDSFPAARRAAALHRSRPSRPGNDHPRRRDARRRSVRADELSHALALVVDGRADAVCFTPFNKQAMRLAEPSYDDEIGFTTGVLGTTGRRDRVQHPRRSVECTGHFARADGRCASARSTSTISSKRWRSRPTRLRAAGFDPPRIAVAALNPHAGDGGNFGREEIDIIGPAVHEAKAQGPQCPRDHIPADTVFVRATTRRFRRGADDVSRPGPDRDEAHGLRSRRHADRRLPVSDLHAGARHGLRHRRQGHRQLGATRAAFLLAAEMARRALY